MLLPKKMAFLLGMCVSDVVRKPCLRKAGKELMRLERPEQAAVTLDQAAEILRGVPQVLCVLLEPPSSACRAMRTEKRATE